jgi:hypothetical protein
MKLTDSLPCLLEPNRALHLKPAQSNQYYVINSHLNNTLQSTFTSSKWFLQLSFFLQLNVCTYYLFCLACAYPDHLILHDLITLIVFCDDYEYTVLHCIILSILLMLLLVPLLYFNTVHSHIKFLRRRKFWCLPREEIRFPHSSAVCQARKKNPKNRTTMPSTAWSVNFA